MSPPTAGDIPLDGLAERLAEDDLSLGILTDEQLAALGQPLHPQGPRGWFAELDEDARMVATQAALRSLLARGMLAPGEEAQTLSAHPALELLRSSRLHAVGMTMAEHHGHDLPPARELIHLVAAGVVLEELIDPDGLHACTMRSPERAALALAGRCDPEQVAGPRSGEPMGGDGEHPEVLAHIDGLRERTVWRTELVVVRRADAPDEDTSSSGPGDPADYPSAVYDQPSAVADHLTLAAIEILALPDAVWGVTATPATPQLPAATMAVELSATELPATLLGFIDPDLAREDTDQGEQEQH